MLSADLFRTDAAKIYLELEFYSQNLKIGQVMVIEFFIGNSQDFTVDVTTKPFLPQNYDRFEMFNTMKLLLFVLFMVLTVFHLVSIIYLVVKEIKNLVFKGRFGLEWFHYLDCVILVLSLISIGFMFSMFVA